MIVDPENYMFIINVTNKKLTLEEMKKAATMKPLLESKCVSMNKNIETANYKIVLF